MRPVSRPRLLQEILIEQDPSGWRLLCGCVLLNVTTRVQADRVWPILFRRWPEPQRMARARATSVERVLHPLGCSCRRAETLRRMSREFLDALPRTRDDALGLYGLGRYAADSWSIFVEGDLSVEPTDKVLRAWLDAGRA